MPSSKEHISYGWKTGAITGAAQNIQKQVQARNCYPDLPFDLGELVGQMFLGSIAGACGAMIPDLMEPARHPNHRSSFHSVTALGIVGYAFLKALQQPSQSSGLWAPFLSGYGFHLLADSQTPKGLPWI